MGPVQISVFEEMQIGFHHSRVQDFNLRLILVLGNKLLRFKDCHDYFEELGKKFVSANKMEFPTCFEICCYDEQKFFTLT